MFVNTMRTRPAIAGTLYAPQSRPVWPKIGGPAPNSKHRRRDWQDLRPGSPGICLRRRAPVRSASHDRGPAHPTEKVRFARIPSGRRRRCGAPPKAMRLPRGCRPLDAEAAADIRRDDVDDVARKRRAFRTIGFEAETASGGLRKACSDCPAHHIVRSPSGARSD